MVSGWFKLIPFFVCFIANLMLPMRQEVTGLWPGGCRHLHLAMGGHSEKSVVPKPGKKPSSETNRL